MEALRPPRASTSRLHRRMGYESGHSMGHEVRREVFPVLVMLL